MPRSRAREEAPRASRGVPLRFNHVIVVDRDDAGNPRVLAKVPVRGGAVAKRCLCVPDFDGTPEEARETAVRLAKLVAYG